MATKKQKREAGENRAAFYLEEERQRNLEAQKAANKRRAELRERRLREQKRGQNREIMKMMAGRQNDLTQVADCESV